MHTFLTWLSTIPVGKIAQDGPSQKCGTNQSNVFPSGKSTMFPILYGKHPIAGPYLPC